MHPTASLFVKLGIASVALGVVSMVVLGYRRAAGGAGRLGLGLFGWAALTAALGASGLLQRWSLPPPLMGLLVLSLAGAVLLSRSRVGERLTTLPLWALVGFQGFRLPLELVMHSAATEGTMPGQMSYGAGGWNYDIVSGASAIAVAVLVRRGLATRGLVAVWNALAMGLLLVIAVVAVVSTPTFGLFGPERLNSWVAFAPFVWMGTINVPAALFGHLVLLRRLAADRDQPGLSANEAQAPAFSNG